MPNNLCFSTCSKTENSEFESDTCKMLNLQTQEIFKWLMWPHLPDNCTYCGGPHLHIPVNTFEIYDSHTPTYKLGTTSQGYISRFLKDNKLI